MFVRKEAINHLHCNGFDVNVTETDASGSIGFLSGADVSTPFLPAHHKAALPRNEAKNAEGPGAKTFTTQSPVSFLV